MSAEQPRIDIEVPATEMPGEGKKTPEEVRAVLLENVPGDTANEKLTVFASAFGEDPELPHVLGHSEAIAAVVQAIKVSDRGNYSFVQPGQKPKRINPETAQGLFALGDSLKEATQTQDDKVEQALTTKPAAEASTTETNRQPKAMDPPIDRKPTPAEAMAKMARAGNNKLATARLATEGEQSNHEAASNDQDKSAEPVSPDPASEKTKTTQPSQVDSETTEADGADTTSDSPESESVASEDATPKAEDNEQSSGSEAKAEPKLSPEDRKALEQKIDDHNFNSLSPRLRSELRALRVFEQEKTGKNVPSWRIAQQMLAEDDQLTEATQDDAESEEVTGERPIAEGDESSQQDSPTKDKTRDTDETTESSSSEEKRSDKGDEGNKKRAETHSGSPVEPPTKLMTDKEREEWEGYATGFANSDHPQNVAFSETARERLAADAVLRTALGTELAGISEKASQQPLQLEAAETQTDANTPEPEKPASQTTEEDEEPEDDNAKTAGESGEDVNSDDESKDDAEESEQTKAEDEQKRQELLNYLAAGLQEKQMVEMATELGKLDRDSSEYQQLTDELIGLMAEYAEQHDFTPDQHDKLLNNVIKGMTPENNNNAAAYREVTRSLDIDTLHNLANAHEAYVKLAAERERRTITPKRTNKKVEDARLQYEFLRHDAQQCMLKKLKQAGYGGADRVMIARLDDDTENESIGLSIQMELERLAEPKGFLAKQRAWFLDKWASWGGGEKFLSKQRMVGDAKKAAVMVGVGLPVGIAVGLVAATSVASFGAAAAAAGAAAGIARGLARGHVEKQAKSRTVVAQQIGRRLVEQSNYIESAYHPQQNANDNHPIFGNDDSAYDANGNFRGMKDVTSAYAEGTERSVTRNRRRMFGAAVIGLVAGAVGGEIGHELAHVVGIGIHDVFSHHGADHSSGAGHTGSIKTPNGNGQTYQHGSGSPAAKGTGGAHTVPTTTHHELRPQGKGFNVEHGSGEIPEIQEYATSRGHNISAERATQIWDAAHAKFGDHVVNLDGTGHDVYHVHQSNGVLDTRLTQPGEAHWWSRGVEEFLDDQIMQKAA